MSATFFDDVPEVTDVSKQITDKVVEVVQVGIPNNNVPKEISTALVKLDDSHWWNDVQDFFSPKQHPERIVILGAIVAIIGYYCLSTQTKLLNDIIQERYHNIDFDDVAMYYINLDRSTKRRAEFERQTYEQGLNVTRFPAIDGRKIKNEIINQVLGHPRSARFKRSVLLNNRKNIGHFGCFLSHIQVYRTFLKTNKPYCLIFEDDAEFKTLTFKKDVDTHMGNIPNDWDIILFGFHTADDLHYGKNQKTFLKNNIFHKLEHFTGLQGYMINRQSCEKLLNKLVNPTWYIDWEISKLASNDEFNIYGVYKPIVCQPACYTVKFDNPQLFMHYIQDCKHGGGMATTFSE